MLVRDSKKHQPEFDLAEARRVYALGGYDKEITGQHVTSPHHLFSVETLRDRYGLRVGPTVATDVFVFGKGKPPRPECTQIGGDPFWPAGRNWPTDDGGNPYKFFAQINFADSKDLVGELPGDLLLIFIGDEEEWFFHPMQVKFEWVTLGSEIQSEFDRSLIANAGGPFYGAIYRTADYPDAETKFDDVVAEESPNLSVWSSTPDWATPEVRITTELQLYKLPILNGTKIGGLPSFIQNGGDLSGQFLCQVASIQAAPCVPYPWVNRPEPLGLGFGLDTKAYDGAIGDKENEVIFGDLGSIYIFRAANGEILSTFECY